MQVLNKRPKLITAICVMGFIWIVFSFPAVFSPSVKKLGDWYPALFGVIVAFSFIAFIGVWYMKRWGANLYMITFFVKQILLLYINDVSYAGLVVSSFFIIVMLIFYKKMDFNL